jgi:hypothetical protein
VIKGLVVSLSEDLPQEEADRLREAILLLKGVIRVEVHSADSYQDTMVRRRVENEWRTRILAAMEER